MQIIWVMTSHVDTCNLDFLTLYRITLNHLEILLVVCRCMMSLSGSVSVIYH